ncbi:MAG: hypothetical protein IJ553_02960 [Alloprevotella sp.]|nr:hypothetical protein [Alloprevotella sp.]
MDTVQHVILDHTLQRIGDPLFADYICHAYCHEGFCTFVRHGQSFRFEAGDCMIIARRGVIIIPKSTHKERMAQNLDLFDFELTAAEMEQIATLDLRKSLFFDHHDAEATKMFMGWRYRQTSFPQRGCSVRRDAGHAFFCGAGLRNLCVAVGWRSVR